jgi:hypothetical protein
MIILNLEILVIKKKFLLKIIVEKQIIYIINYKSEYLTICLL